MATINDLNEEQKKAAEGGGLNTSGTAGTISGGATGASTTASGAGGASAGSGWTNLQSYLDVNQGQGGKLADQVGQDANNQVDKFKSTDASSVVGEIGKAAGTEQKDKIVSNVAGNIGDAKSFLGQGFGAKQVTDYTAPVQATADSVKGTLSQLNDQNYQKGTLQKLNNKQGNYSGGFGALDSFILSGDAKGREQLSNIQQTGTGAVDSKLGDYTKQISDARASAKSLFDANQQAVKDAGKNQYGSILNQAALNAKAKSGESKTTAANAINQRRLEAIQGDSGLGTDDTAGDAFLKGADLSATDVLTDADVTALNSLAGLDPGLGLGSVARTQGTGYSADLEGYGQFLGQKKGALDAKRAADKKAADDKAAAEAKARAEAEAQARLEAEKAAKASAAGDAFSQAYGMPQGYTPTQVAAPAPEPAPTNTRSKEEVIGTQISDAGKQIVAAPGGAWDALTAPLQPAAGKAESKVNSTIKNAKKGKVKF